MTVFVRAQPPEKDNGYHVPKRSPDIAHSALLFPKAHKGSLVFPTWPQTDSGTSNNLCNYTTIGSDTSEGLHVEWG